MLQGIVIQAAQAKPGLDLDPSLRQTIIIPAASMMWVRSITASHPRKTWRKRPTWSYDLATPFASSTIESDFAATVEDRNDQTWHLTGDPVGFQITDDEYLELKAGNMPRNVPLRAQRALEATGQTLIGKGAVKRPADFIGTTLPRVMSYHAEPTLGGRLTADLAQIAAWIDGHDMARLNTITPRDARARGAGSHRNAAGLPDASTGSEASPSAPVVVAPVAPAAPRVREAAVGAVKPGDTVMAADGVPYIARAVEADEKNLSDVELFRRAYAANMNVFLMGEPGTGKTRGLLAAFPDALVVNVTGDTEVSDLIGSYVPTGPDSFAWQDGPLIRAMEDGRMLVMDEGGLADSKVLALLYPLMDKKGDARKILVTANPARGTVYARDGFGIAFTTNPNAKGVHIAEPLLSRCAITMTVGSDYAVARKLGCNERLVQAAEHMSKQRETGEMGWAPEMRNLLDARDLEAKFGIVMALRALIMQAPELEREVVEIQLRERFGDVAGAARKVKALGI